MILKCMGNHLFIILLNQQIEYRMLIDIEGKHGETVNASCSMFEKQLSIKQQVTPRWKIDVLRCTLVHRPWRQCSCNFETLVGTNIQTAHLAPGHRVVVRIRWNPWWNDGILWNPMEPYGIVISQVQQVRRESMVKKSFSFSSAYNSQ